MGRSKVSGYEDLTEEQQTTAPHWVFEVDVDEEPRARLFGPKEKRNWILWKLSQYCVALEDEGAVTVRRWINGEWREANDWRNLAH